MTKLETGGGEQSEYLATLTDAEIMNTGIDFALIDPIRALNRCESECKLLLKNNACSDFPVFEEKLASFKELISQFTQSTLEELQHSLGGEMWGHQTFIDVILKTEQSPFSLDRLHSWIGGLKHDMDVVGSYMKELHSVRVILSSQEVTETIDKFSKTYLVCFAFFLDGAYTEYVNHMRRYVDSGTTTACVIESKWNNESTDQNIRYQANLFNEFATLNIKSNSTLFAVMVQEREQNNASEACSILLYESGKPTPTNLTLPRVHEKPICTRVKHNAITITWHEAHTGSTFLDGYVVKYWKKSENVNCTENTIKNQSTSLRIENLEPDTCYEFSVATCGMWTGPYSEKSDICRTLPVSPPLRVRKVNVYDTCILLEWDPPEIISTGTSVTRYNITYEQESNMTGKTVWLESNEAQCLFTVSNLTPNTDYTLSVFAVCSSGAESDSSKTVVIKTANKPPKLPVKPSIIKIVHNAVTMSWINDNVTNSDIEYYEVQYHEQFNTNMLNGTWICLPRQSQTQTSVDITDLKCNTCYKFAVVIAFGNGMKMMSTEVSCKTLPASPPFGLTSIKQTITRITVSWTKPPDLGDGVSVQNYVIKCLPKEDGGKINKFYTKDDSCTFTLNELRPAMKYEISVRANCGDDGHSDDSSSILVSTETIIPKSILDKCHTVVGRDYLKYELCLKKVNERRGVYCIYHVGDEPKSSEQNLVVMMVGETGSGKTTLINAMINYILGVNWSDKHRYSITASLHENKGKSEAESQTNMVTAYTLNVNEGAKFKGNLTIIDTPGFGDTGGMQKDAEITQKIRKFLTDSSKHKIEAINVIGLVTQASQARLTSTQSYVFETILGLFGNDMEDNIFTFVTYADAEDPPVWKAIKAAEIPCPIRQMFRFNNSSLFVTDKKERNESLPFSSEGKIVELRKLLWEMGAESTRDFLAMSISVNAISLARTVEVIIDRERVEELIKALLEQIRVSLGKKSNLKRQKESLTKCEKTLQHNKALEYDYPVSKIKHTELDGIQSLNCPNCNTTCHCPCSPPLFGGYFCSVMSWSGSCKICKDKCGWQVHKRHNYKIEYYTDYEKRKIESAQQTYEAACEEKKRIQNELEDIEKEVKDLDEHNSTLHETLMKSFESLKQKALRSNVVHSEDHIEVLIKLKN